MDTGTRRQTKWLLATYTIFGLWEISGINEIPEKVGQSDEDGKGSERSRELF